MASRNALAPTAIGNGAQETVGVGRCAIRSSSKPKQQLSRAHFFVTDGRDFVGTVYLIEGRFIAVDINGAVVARFDSLHAASQALLLAGVDEPKDLRGQDRSALDGRGRENGQLEAAGAAAEALGELQGLQVEFQAWREGLPEKFQDTALAEKLDPVCALDIDGALATVEDAEAIDLPRGFGRDR
jgi:hypothetical protein